MAKTKLPVRNWEDYLENTPKNFKRYMDHVMQRIDEQDFTPIEKITAYMLRGLYDQYGHKNIEIHPQKQIGKYRVDFEIIHHPYFLRESQPELHKIVVECDGHDFHEKTKEQAQKDRERDRYLAKEGYTVLRFTGRDIVTDAYSILSDIEAILDPEEYKRIQDALKEDGYDG